MSHSHDTADTEDTPDTEATQDTEDNASSDSESEGAKEDSLGSADVVPTAPTPSPSPSPSPSPREQQTKMTKMKDAFLTFLLFVTLLTFGMGGNGPTMLPTSSKGANEGTPIAAAPPNLRTKPSPEPSPFFDIASAIDDFYNGDVYEAFSEAERHENALIFFYAPWDADSRATRNVLEIVADIFTDSDLYFGAVNCWTPKGECYKQFGSDQSLNESKLKDQAPSINPRLPHFQFPILVFYPRDRKGIQYNGPISVEALVEFLLSARSPVEHLRSVSDLTNLQARHNGRAIVGYFPDLLSSRRSTGRQSLKSFVDASLHFLETDPFRVSTGGYGVVTSEQLACKLHLGSSQPVRLFLWNSTSVAYPNKTITSASAFMNWSIWKFQAAPPLASWAEVHGRKSLSLSKKLSSGSGYSLLVFIPRINRLIFNEALSIVQEVSIFYKSCKEIENRTRDIIQAIRSLRRESILKVDSLLETCRTDPWFVKTFENRPLCRKYFGETIKNVSASLLNQSFKDRKTLIGRRKHFRGRSLRDGNINELQLIHSRLECTLAHSAASNLQPRSASSEYEAFQSELNLELTGLGCTDNRTLNLYTLDYQTQRGLAESLGLNGPKIHTLIVNPTLESYYLMEEEFSAENLSRFIAKFHLKQDDLPEAKLSEGFLRSSDLHHRREEKVNAQKDSFENVRKRSKLKNAIGVDELSRLKFLTSSWSSPLLLLYTSPSCGFCASASRTFLAVKMLLDKKAPNLLSFAAIDSHSNDLPWSFTAISSPTVIYVPYGNFTDQGLSPETRVFPLTKALNVPNLLNFIVANIPPHIRDTLAASFNNSLKDSQVMESQSNDITNVLHDPMPVEVHTHIHGEL